jgi:hypothetical protein
MKGLALILLVSIALASCTKKDYCLQPNAVVVRCGFYYNDGSITPADTVLDDITIYTTDTTYRYYNNDTNVSKLNYFIQSTRSEQQIVILYEALESYDTIWVQYTPALNFISNGCGYQYEYTLDSVRSTSHIIEEVNITNASVNSESTLEHLEIIIQ